MKLPPLTPRARDAHKGAFGKILIIGGSRAMPGAVALAAGAALRSGAGLVKVATPLSTVTAVAAFSPCYTFLPCPETSEGVLGRIAVPLILEEAKGADVLALGPGISTQPETMEAVSALVRGTDQPLVIDADGLNLVAQDLDAVVERKGLCVLTPHPGEFARLYGSKPPGDEQGRIAAAKALAERTRAIVLLKGKGTVVTDGSTHFVIATGNPGMATAGSGDVLTGMIAALLFAVPQSIEAVALAAHLHGLSGDLAAQDLGEISLTSKDILDYLPRTFLNYQGSRES